MGGPTCFPAWKTLPCSEWPALPRCHCAWYVGGAQIFLEWTNLFELCLCLHFQFLLTRNCLLCRCLQEFRLWVWHYLCVNTPHYVVSLDEGGGVWVLIPTPAFTMVFILQITTPIQRVKGLATNSVEKTLGLLNACGNHKRFLDLIPLTLFLGPWELFFLFSSLGLNINRFFIVFNLTLFYSWKNKGDLVSCKSTTKVITLLFIVWWVLPWVLLLIILFNSLNNSMTIIL